MITEEQLKEIEDRMVDWNTINEYQVEKEARVLLERLISELRVLIKPKPRIVKLEMTCGGCPMQWDAWDSEGVYYYIRERHGYLTVSIRSGGTSGEGLLLDEVVDEMISEQDMKKVTAGIFEWAT